VSGNIDGLVYEDTGYAGLTNPLESKWSVRSSLKLEAGSPGTAVAYYNTAQQSGEALRE
jgi:hypothetical protein